MDIIKVKNLSKNFDQTKAVNNISFKVNSGEIFGLLGPNGAGKTTTIRILTSIIKPSKGKAWIGKFEVQENPLAAKGLIGVVPETANAYLDLSATKNLDFAGELYGIRKDKRSKKAEELLNLFELSARKDDLVKTFSKGLKQRLILAMALINDSKILFLDEPTSGLDVKSSRLIRKLIKELNLEGKTIFLTTHNIEEANLLCDRVAIMNKGKIAVIDRPEKLKERIQKTLNVEVAFEKKIDLNKLKREIKIINEVQKQGDRIIIATDNPGRLIYQLVDHARSSANQIVSLNTLKPSLEDVFLKITEEER